MLLLASADTRILKRWGEALAGRGPLAQVDNAERLRLFLRQRRPDLILLHLSLPGLAEHGGVKALKHSFPATRVLVMSDVPHEEEGLALLHSRVEGYANTYMMAEKLRSAVNVIGAGQVWLGRQLLERLLGAQYSPEDQQPALLELLSKREKQVALLVAEGTSNRDIADRLEVKERTIKSHLTSIFKKTGIRDRTQLALRMSGRNASDKAQKDDYKELVNN